ncbi:hypothetical protein ABPG73_021217 [Tetrahymena malaccensis]
MNYQIISLLILCAIQICFCTQCQSYEIYSLIAQSCLQCSQQCSTCFNTNESACISCDANLFKSSDNSSTCVKKCSSEEFLNENLECVRCQVYGCIKCDKNQICQQCAQNFQIDLMNNQCILVNNICPFQTNFIQGPSNLKQCTQECSQSFYQNMEAKICQETIKCIQIEESSRFSFDQRVSQIQTINDNQYLVEGNGCTFALVDYNWKVIYKQILQNMTDYDYQYTSLGDEVSKKSFIVGNQVGCTVDSKLLVMDFKTFEIIIESNTIYDYYVYYIDQKNQVVFLLSYYSSTLLWYDAVNNVLNKSQITTSQLLLLFQIEINSSINYIIQGLDFQFQIGTLNEQRQLVFQNIDQQNLDNFIFLDVKQFNDYFIAISASFNEYVQVIKLDIQQDLICLVNIIEQFSGTQQTQDLSIYYSNMLNSIIMQNTDSLKLEILILNQQSDEVVSKLNLTSVQINSFRVFEDLPSNSTMVFIFTESLEIMNLTYHLISFNQDYPQTFQNQFKPLNQNYISKQSKITNLIINLDQKIMDVFIAQIFSEYTAFQQQIRLQYNLTDFTFKIQYLNPYQFETFYYDESSIISQNQFIVTHKDKSNKNVFLIFDSQQTFLNQTLGYIAIQESIQNFQKNPKINTKMINLNQNTLASLETYQFISQISNQYILIQQSIDQIKYYYVIDIEQEKQILSYNQTDENQETIYFYFEDKNLLFVQNIPQIFNLSNSQQLINDDQTQFLSFTCYVIIKEDYIVYQSLNSQSEMILYLLDLSTLQSTLLYKFQQNQIISFWTADNTQYYPVIFDNDIIYFCNTDQMPVCQPFSINAQNFIMEATQLQLFPDGNPTVIYQKTKEIFIFYSGIIQIYSYDLKNQTQLNLGIQYPSNSYNTQQNIFSTERYVFYFDLTYFYKFDMELKQYEIIEAETQYILNYELIINFYKLNSNSYVKKSGKIIDTENMIIIKTQQENNYFLGQTYMNDIQLHIFQQVNEVYWHKNILNIPFYTLNFTTSQTFQDLYFEKGQNLIALYDSSCQCVLIYDIIKNIKQVSQVLFNAQFDLNIKLIDWNNSSFIYVIGSSFYLYNPKKNEKYEQIGLLDSKIIKYEYCYQQQVIVAQTQQQNLYIIREHVQSKIETNFNYLNQQIVLQLKFILKCSENILIIYSPVTQIINLLTEGDELPFQDFNMSKISNYAQNIPIVNLKEKLLINQFNIDTIYFQRNDFNNYINFFDYRQNNTNIFYDLNNNILIGMTGVIKKISIMIIPGDQQLFIYYTINSFLQSATFYFEDQTSLILIDTTPIIYLFNYIQRNVTTFNTFIKDTYGIQMDQNKNIIFLYSYQFISALKYPEMQLIEMFSLQQYNQASILDIYINQLIQVLIVQTRTAFIAFDLTEVLYEQETSLIQYQKIQNIYLNDEYQIFYSLSNLSLNLYYKARLVDSLLFEKYQQNIYPYFTEPILISENQFIYFTFNYLNLIQVNFQQNSLVLISKIQLQNTPDNFFYDFSQNKILLLYKSNFQLNSLNVQMLSQGETFLSNFQQGDIQNAFICSYQIIVPSNNYIQIYNIRSNQIFKVALPTEGTIQVAFKLQIKQISQQKNNWWKIPFEDNRRFNTNDWINEQQFTKNVFIILKQDYGSTILILDLLSREFNYKINVNNWQIMNVVNDPFKQLIYLVSNEATTNVFSYSLDFITSIANPCLKQAIISFDQNFVYSICPNDIIVYNGISFDQQFPTINNGISEANNLINMNYNNYVIVIQKNKLSIIQLKYNDTQLTIYEYEQKNAFVQSFQLIINSYNQRYASFLISNYQNITQILLPLSVNKLCSVYIQQQNRTAENIYTKTALSQITQAIQSTNQILSIIEIEYLDGQSIEQTNIDVQDLNKDQTHKLSLRLLSQYQNNIQWLNDIKFSQQVFNLFLKQMSLSIKTQVNLNLGGSMENFQMLNVSLSLYESFNLQNFKKVYLQQMFIKVQNSSQILISNCELVVIDQLYLQNIEMLQKIIFVLTNNTNVLINNIYLSDSISSSIFQISESQAVNISNVIIKNCSYLNNVFELWQINNLNIVNTSVSQSSLSTIYFILSTTISTIQKIKLFQSIQVSIVQIKEQDINTVQYLSDYAILKDLEISNCVDMIFYFKTNTFEFFDVSIDLVKASQTTFNIQANQINITHLNITNTEYLFSRLDVYLINIIGFTNFNIENIISNNNQISLFSINQQNNLGYGLISRAKFMNFSIFNQNPLILLNQLSNVELKNILIKEVINTKSSHISIVFIQNCDLVTITESQFINNTNVYGPGGVIYAIENKQIKMQNSQFYLNKCKLQNGGAIFMINSIQQGVLQVNQTEFIENKSEYSSGGAIYLQNNNLIMQNSVIISNQAQIGGGLYYISIIPDILVDFQQGNKNNNTLKDNLARIYGQNIGSTLRKISINLENIKIPKTSFKSQQNSTIHIQQFKSGDQINFQQIQLLDEEDNPIKFMDVNSTNFYLLSSDVQSIIQQISVSLSWNQENKEIQCIGQLQTKQFINGGFDLDVQVFYKPISNMVLKIDKQNQFQIQIQNNVLLVKYLRPMVIQQYVNLVLIFYCSEGYKGPLCYQCDTYGDIWGNRYSEILSPGSCHKCETNIAKIIIYNLLLYLVISLYIFIILKRIIVQLEVKVKGYYLNRLGIIYLGSTLNQSDRSQIISKILTDHLQILSLVCSFKENVPISFTLPIQLSGNPVSITSKSIDCVFSKFPELQPLWLFESLWSFGDKKYLDLDLNVQCYDKNQHKPYILLYSIPDYTLSSPSPQTRLTTSSEINDEKQCILQNKNSNKRVKNKWSYYSRNSKLNQTSLKDRTFSKQSSLFNSNIKDNNIQETENSIQNNFVLNSNHKFQIQQSHEKN